MINEANRAGANLIKLQVVDPSSNYEKLTSSYKILKTLLYQMNKYSDLQL